MDDINKLILNPKFAYFMGFFAADGTYYKNSRSNNIEFSDGTSVPEEIEYSKCFLNEIRKIIETLLDINVPDLRRRGNRYTFQFANKRFSIILKKIFDMEPGPKSTSFKIPDIYKGNGLEKFFWLGVMDGDGMIARNSRKVALEMVNRELIYSFRDFLDRNNILCSLRERKLDECSSAYKTKNKSFKATVNAPFFGKYKELLGFHHPRKKLWLEKHGKKKHAYIDNEIVSLKEFTINGMIDYSRIFDSKRIFIVKGKSLLYEHGIKIKGRENVKFIDVYNLFRKNGFTKENIFTILSKQKWKMSKGSINSVDIPLYVDKKLLDIAKVVRIRDDEIVLSRSYIKSMGFDKDVIISNIKKIFGIEPKYTKKGEPMFCSGVLSFLFSKIIKRRIEEYKMPDWHKELEC